MKHITHTSLKTYCNINLTDYEHAGIADTEDGNITIRFYKQHKWFKATCEACILFSSLS